MAKFVYLRDLRNITQQEFEKAHRIANEINNLVGMRMSYLREHNIDPEIGLPGSNWDINGENDFYRAYLFVSNIKYEVINHLRLYTQAFTGYQLVTLSMGRGTHTPLVPISDSHDEFLSKHESKRNRWVDKYAIAIKYLPRDITAFPPKMLGEIGWDVNGTIVNHDTAIYQERLNLLYESGIIDFLRDRISKNGKVNILEIGSGYGALAFYLKNIFPEGQYYLCDIPETLLFSSIYLSLTCPQYRHIIYNGKEPSQLRKGENGFIFVTNYMFDDMLNQNIHIDLVINTLSLSEMTEKQVRYYAAGVKKLIGTEGVFFEQNQNNEHCGFLNCKKYLIDYFPFRKTIWSVTTDISQGQSDIWANVNLSDIIQPTFEHLIRLIVWLKLKFWRRYYKYLTMINKSGMKIFFLKVLRRDGIKRVCR